VFGGRSGRLGPMASLVAAVNLVAGCMPVTIGPAGPGVPPPQVGPTLVLQVTNRSPAMLTVGYEFEGGNVSGGGEGSIEPCQSIAMPFGDVAGHYRVLVNGETVGEGDTPPGFGRFVFLIVDVSIDADGNVETRPHRISRVEPPMMPRPIADCG
jgi:hypothetical protein